MLYTICLDCGSTVRFNWFSLLLLAFESGEYCFTVSRKKKGKETDTKNWVTLTKVVQPLWSKRKHLAMSKPDQIRGIVRILFSILFSESLFTSATVLRNIVMLSLHLEASSKGQRHSIALLYSFFLEIEYTVNLPN